MTELLAGHMAQWACSVAFPELAHVPMLALRRFVKRTAVARFSAAAKGLLAAMEANAAFVEAARRAAEFAPKDTVRLQAFLSQEDAAQKVCRQCGRSPHDIQAGHWLPLHAWVPIAAP